MAESHPVHKLARLVADVKAELPEPLPDPASYSEALRGLVNRDFLGTAKYRSQQTRANRVGAAEEIVAFERAFVSRMAKLGVPMFAHCVCRDEAEQARLFVQGVSQAKPGRSPHQFGMAVDIVHSTRAWEVPNAAWELIGHIGKEVAHQAGIGVVWGGDWRFWDPAHWELRDWKSRVNSPAPDRARV